MTFAEYLITKKIDFNLFQVSDPEQFSEWQKLFEFTHPDSFTAQKRFLINEVRRRYLLTELKQ